MGSRPLLLVAAGLVIGLACLFLWDDVIGPALGVGAGNDGPDGGDAPIRLFENIHHAFGFRPVDTERFQRRAAVGLGDVQRGADRRQHLRGVGDRDALAAD